MTTKRTYVLLVKDKTINSLIPIAVGGSKEEVNEKREGWLKTLKPGDEKLVSTRAWRIHYVEEAVETKPADTPELKPHIGGTSFNDLSGGSLGIAAAIEGMPMARFTIKDVNGHTNVAMLGITQIRELAARLTLLADRLELEQVS